MSLTTFILNPKFEEELGADAATKAAILVFANDALAGAQAAAPVLVGTYRESLFADETGLGSTSSLWALIEYGSMHNPPSAPLRRGVEGAGVKWSDP